MVGGENVINQKSVGPSKSRPQFYQKGRQGGYARKVCGYKLDSICLTGIKIIKDRALEFVMEKQLPRSRIVLRNGFRREEASDHEDSGE
jgi:hypothetical protein